MSDKYVFEKTVGEDGTLQLPPDAPRGHIRITVEPVETELSSQEEAELDAELAELLSDENLRGQGLTAGEIAHSPEFGAWEHRTDIESGESFVEKMRQKRRYTW